MKTQEEMNFLIPERLQEIEKKHNVEILWAVESGSRAWGFASPDSDFDVRFIYKRPMQEYLKLKKNRDVLELPIDATWDVSGWDLDKALKLLYRSNPNLYEWFGSPICYRRTGFENAIRPLLKEYFSAERMLYHYKSMAMRHMGDYWKDETIQPKKYFYALRPILACSWIMNHGTPPPVRFLDLVESELPENLRPVVDHLLDLKMNGPEKMTIAPLIEVDDYLESGLLAIDQYLQQRPNSKPGSWEPLDRFFLEMVS